MNKRKERYFWFCFNVPTDTTKLWGRSKLPVYNSLRKKYFLLRNASLQKEEKIILQGLKFLNSAIKKKSICFKKQVTAIIKEVKTGNVSFNFFIAITENLTPRKPECRR